MNWGQFLFSPSGRINRARYWGALATQYGILIATWLPAIVILDDKGGREPNPIVAGVYVVIAIIISCAFLLSHFFAQVKRFHDRDKPWPWIFIGFVPYIGSFWILIECGMLAGTRGRNRFGPDPLGNSDDIVDVFGPAEGTPVPQPIETR